MRHSPLWIFAVLLVLAGHRSAVSPATAITPAAGATAAAAIPVAGMTVAAADSAAVSIVEPPLKPPATWSYEPAVVGVRPSGWTSIRLLF
jgi:hypothetical protein